MWLTILILGTRRGVHKGMEVSVCVEIDVVISEPSDVSLNLLFGKVCPSCLFF